MAIYNSGLIYTDSSCIGCGRCMSSCPAEEANITIFRSNKRHLEVDPLNCVVCGKCLEECIHSARKTRDDTESFFEDLAAGKKISLIVAPSFYILYADTANNIIGYLRSLGVDKVYDSGFGGDISVWAHAKYIKEYAGDPEKRAFIANTCPTVVNYIERYSPQNIPYLIPVHSPLACTALYARKYLGDDSEFAFLNACVASKNEMEETAADTNIKYNLVFDHFMEKLEGKGIGGYYGESDLRSSNLGTTLSARGGFREYMSYLFPEEELIVHYEGLNRQTLGLINTTSHTEIKHPLMSEMAACVGGCCMGSGAAKVRAGGLNNMFGTLRKMRLDSIETHRKYSEPDTFYSALCELFGELDPADFSRRFREKYIQSNIIPETIINEVFTRMHKNTPEERSFDCRLCGYNTCRELVNAVAKGTARIEDCGIYVNSELRRKLYYDAMTGLYSSEGFNTEGRKYLLAHSDKKFIACAGNVNGIKAVNDLYDFNTGTQIIIYIAKKLSEIVNDNGICARLGGNNFLLCMENTPENMEKLKSIRYFDCHHLGITMPISMRFGLCEIKEVNDLTRIVNYASFAMEKNVNRTENTFTVYDERMRKEIETETHITSTMRQAMKNGEFTMFLQPQYNHNNGKMVGAESLCRWIKPDGTVVSPGIFIPIFEKNGFIRELDRYMWECAFRQVRKWTDEGTEAVPISVNISRMSLTDDEIIKVISSLQNRYAIETKYLHFEITESAYTDNQQQLIARIGKIRDLGFEIAMDDFGSGYSSLNTLKDIPIDILKLDMGFLRGDTNAEKGGNIIGSVIRMAHSLELITVAEGVETLEQADFLRSLGCDVIQGYLYAKPMPIPQYETLLKNGVQGKLDEQVERPEISLNRFFDPSSGETKLFENYMGAAALFEFDGRNALPLRVNDAFMKQFRFTDKRMTDIHELFIGNIEETDREKLLGGLERTAAGKKDTSCIFRYTIPGGSLLVKARIMYLSRNGQKTVLHVLTDDISDAAAYCSGS